MLSVSAKLVINRVCMRGVSLTMMVLKSVFDLVIVSTVSFVSSRYRIVPVVMLTLVGHFRFNGPF